MTLFIRSIILILLFQFITSATIKKEQDDEAEFRRYRRVIDKMLPNIPESEKLFGARLLQAHEANRTRLQTEKKLKNHQFQQIPPWNCTSYPPSPEIPMSVDKLTPGDIKIVAGLGDSQTAAFGAKAQSILHILNEYRGVSWSIGGDGDVQTLKTLPNVLKAYNPDIYGYSTGVACYDDPDSHYNRAISGSRAPMLIMQALDLIVKMKTDPMVDIDRDWKLITIWIGSNDLCDICEDEFGVFSPDRYESNIRVAMDLIKSELPRVFINLVQGIDVTVLHEVQSTWCEWLHYFECPCGASDDEDVRRNVTSTLREYNKRLADIARDPKYNTDDMAVVIQPFLTNTDIPKNEDGSIDLDYFAPDCFHFSTLSHEAAAVALWNNMFEPVDQKKLDWVPGEPFECPEVGSFLYTNRNSGKFTFEGGRDTKTADFVYRKFLGLWIALSMIGGALLLILLLVVVLKVYMRFHEGGYVPVS